MTADGEGHGEEGGSEGYDGHKDDRGHTVITVILYLVSHKWCVTREEWVSPSLYHRSRPGEKRRARQRHGAKGSVGAEGSVCKGTDVREASVGC